MKSLSHSAMEMFQNCPKQYKHVYISKDIPRIELESGKWGKKVHDKVMAVLRAAVSAQDTRLTVPLDDDIKPYGKYIDTVLGLPGAKQVEMKFGVDHDGKPSAYWGENTVFRLQADLVVVNEEDRFLWIADWKTGKKKQKEHFLQLDRYAYVLSAYYPGYQIAGSFVWLKDDYKDDPVTSRTEVHTSGGGVPGFLRDAGPHR